MRIVTSPFLTCKGNTSTTGLYRTLFRPQAKMRRHHADDRALAEEICSQGASWFMASNGKIPSSDMLDRVPRQ